MTDDILARARCKSPYLQGSSAERMIDELAAEIERLKADKHKLMLWNEQLQYDLDEARAALEHKP